jgi:alpha-amylase/alpha-mannosidase (GH57 family)
VAPLGAILREVNPLASHGPDLEVIMIASPKIDPIQTASGVYVTVHGHFYQPSRENPCLDAAEREPSAFPCHDWNERIHSECYRPNAFARILNDRGEVLGIVNNFEYLSFNVGPTLMSWMERNDTEVYQRIVEADRRSCERLRGHGNAIAQVYNHIIMPLAKERDKYTQIRWGKAEFRSHFGRDPEGMWLAETAVDYPTLEALAAERIRFIILAPSQAQRCRPIPTPSNPDPKWTEAGWGQINPTQPYRFFIPGGNPARDHIDIFFYDGPISADIGFNDILRSSQYFANRIGQAVRANLGKSQLISLATDGETFGHHKKGGEKALAFALIRELPARGWTVTNFAHYLSISPPTWEVQLKPVTAWSCIHGVDRWQDDCGCGSEGGRHQKWRRPLRNTLDWLRDQLAEVYEKTGTKFFTDPWRARDAYIGVIRDRSPASLQQFLAQEENHLLDAMEKVDALRLLEMQRHALLMYTSCGWFFEEVSRPEGVQLLRYAAHAMKLARDVTGIQLEKDFLERLERVPSNVGIFQHGAEIYRQLVLPSQISLEQVAAHYAMSSLFTPCASKERLYCYVIEQLDYELRRMGAQNLAVGEVRLTSEITQEAAHLVFAALHLGGWDLRCSIQPFAGKSAYRHAKKSLFEALEQGSASQTGQALNRMVGDQCYGLQSLLAEERHRILRLLSQETLNRVDELYTQLYRDSCGVLAAFHRDRLEGPQELQVAAEIAMAHKAKVSLEALERETRDFPIRNPQLCLSYLVELEAINTEASHLRCQIKTPQAKETLERLVLRALRHLLHDGNPDRREPLLGWLERLLGLCHGLHLGLACDRAQELFLKIFHGEIIPQLVAWHLSRQRCDFPSNPTAEPETKAEMDWTETQVRRFLDVGRKLRIDVSLFDFFLSQQQLVSDLD